MKQTLFIANVLSSNCGMYFFLDQIWVCVYFSWWYPPPPPPDQKAIQATGKLIQEITKALVVNTIRPYIWLNSKSAAFDPVTSELLPLYRAAKKKTPDMGSQYYIRLNESITMKQTFNCAYYVRVTVLYCFCSFGVVRVFFFPWWMLTP